MNDVLPIAVELQQEADEYNDALREAEEELANDEQAMEVADVDFAEVNYMPQGHVEAAPEALRDAVNAAFPEVEEGAIDLGNVQDAPIFALGHADVFAGENVVFAEPQAEAYTNPPRIRRAILIKTEDFDFDEDRLLTEIGNPIIEMITKSTPKDKLEEQLRGFKFNLKMIIDDEYNMIATFSPNAVTGRFEYEYSDMYYGEEYLKDAHYLDTENPFITIAELRRRTGKRKLYTKILN